MTNEQFLLGMAASCDRRRDPACRMTHQAARLAAWWHRNQKRKYTEEPYFVHLAEVASILAAVHEPETTLQAAYLHDSLEDCRGEAAWTTICELFGEPVANLVLEVTDVSKPWDGNRAKRKQNDLEHLAAASAAAQTLKYADLISNCRDIVENGGGFARVFIAEADALWHALDKGNTGLRRYLRDLLDAATKKLQL